MDTRALDAPRRRLRPYVERARGFSGWMSDVKVRRLGADAPWDYAARAGALMTTAGSVIDLGTGGGERFAAELCEGYHGRALATEEWVVNAPLAGRRLRPLGVGVIRCTSLRLPITGGAFDLVLDRHEELDPAEVARVLAPGGTVLTQQVWRYHDEIVRFIPRRIDFGDHFNAYQQGFRASGLSVVDAREHSGRVAYADLGELVYELCIAPWWLPDFDPLCADLEALLALERELSTPDGVVLSSGSYIIEARKER